MCAWVCACLLGGYVFCSYVYVLINQTIVQSCVCVCVCVCADITTTVCTVSIMNCSMAIEKIYSIYLIPQFIAMATGLPVDKFGVHQMTT